MRITYKRKLKKLSFGIFNSLIDVAIFSLAVYGQAYQGKDPIELVLKAIKAVKIGNPKSYKRAIYNAKHKGYLERKEDYYKITSFGRKRLARILPVYESKRPWDGKLYLVTYDIPELKKKDRDILRSYLKKIGCGMLQHSVWITPYNPTRIMIDFIKEKNLLGLVLVSDLKEGGFIGGKDHLTTMARVFKLEALDQEYRDFCLKVDSGKLSTVEIIMRYLSILKKDPQLPFELLLPGWWGDDAHEMYQSVISRSRPR